MQMLNILPLLLTIALIVGLVFLQLFLSKKENKYLGLLLPILSLLLSLVTVFSMYAFSTISHTESRQVELETTGVVSSEPPSSKAQDVSTQINSAPAEGFFLSMLVTFLLSNIPTVVLVVIYLACREKIKRNRELDKMTLQDLS